MEWSSSLLVYNILSGLNISIDPTFTHVPIISFVRLGTWKYTNFHKPAIYIVRSNTGQKKFEELSGISLYQLSTKLPEKLDAMSTNES